MVRPRAVLAIGGLCVGKGLACRAPQTSASFCRFCREVGFRLPRVHPWCAVGGPLLAQLPSLPAVLTACPSPAAPHHEQQQLQLQ